jgi:DNA-directed RNA polymerase specialized sigma24 family protein/CheY-like chemotaxis protein
MSLSEKIRADLPYLRRYSRALTGSQHTGDHYVKATLEAVIAAPQEFDTDIRARVSLYRIFHKIWESSYTEQLPEVDHITAIERSAQRRLAAITPLSRQILLLTALEGFSIDEVSIITGCSIDDVEKLLDDAVSDLDRETATSVLIIEDEPLISMELEQIVKSCGHTISGTATTRSDAVASIMKNRPGLVLADIQLADGSSGVDAARDILESIDVPIIFITAYPERLLTGERIEPTFLITKPFHPDAVRAAISQALFFELSAMAA